MGEAQTGEQPAGSVPYREVSGLRKDSTGKEVGRWAFRAQKSVLDRRVTKKTVPLSCRLNRNGSAESTTW